jgi:hypothetical protein
VLCALALALWANAAGAATIKGKVTDEGGEGIQGIGVCAQAPFFVYPGDCAWSQPDGTYAIEGLLEVGYHVGFRVERPDQNYAPQWYNGKPHREEGELVAATGGLIEGIDAVMASGGQIVGRVTDRGTGAPVVDLEVCATLVGEFPEGGFVECAGTDAAGEYDLRNLGTGEYSVQFRTGSGPNYIGETRPGNVSVTADQVTPGIDAQLSPGLQIEGHVTDAATGSAPVGLLAPFAGLSTCALDPATEARVRCAPIEADGHYVLTGLPLTTYVVAFALDYSYEGEPVIPDGYVRRYWHEVQNFSEAAPVGSPTSTVISGIDATISRGDEIPPPQLPWVVQGTIHPAPQSPPGEHRAHPKPKKLHCKKGFRRATKSRHQRCVKIHKKKIHHHKGRRKTSPR